MLSGFPATSIMLMSTRVRFCREASLTETDSRTSGAVQAGCIYDAYHEEYHGADINVSSSVPGRGVQSWLKCVD